MGLARLLDPDDRMTNCGTLGYTAPEVQTRKYDGKADIWALAIMFINHFRSLVIQSGANKDK